MDEPLRAAFDAEMAAARAALLCSALDEAFKHFEHAHVLGQWYVLAHARVHQGMLEVALRRGDARETLVNCCDCPPRWSDA